VMPRCRLKLAVSNINADDTRNAFTRTNLAQAPVRRRPGL
jgi:hypothetical protein